MAIVYSNKKVSIINIDTYILHFIFKIDELNCKCQTFMEEKYNTTRNCFAPVRVVKIFGSNSMLSWLKLRMERYNHFIDSLNSQDVFSASFLDEEEL